MTNIVTLCMLILMQALAYLRDQLMRLASADRYLFASTDLRPLFPDHGDDAFRALLTRAARSGVLRRVCRGIYIFPYVAYPRGYELYHTAARLRADTLSWISLETALSDAGVISQVPVGRITLMSTGRTSTISCGHFGTIEFHHTRRGPNEVAGNLVYDPACRLWRATSEQALRDLRAVGRSLDLVNREALDDAL